MAIYELRHDFPISKLINVAKISRSSYYYHISKNMKEDKYACIKNEIRSIFDFHHGRYGYRRITAELNNGGRHINHKTVYRLMCDMKIKCIIRPKRYRSYRNSCSSAPSPNLLNRDFSSNEPLKKLVTDVTEMQVNGTKIYLSPIIDLYNNEVISYSISLRPGFKMIEEMFKTALKILPDNCKAILHSDQGWQYRIPSYKAILNQKGIIQSMSRKANCYDNAVIENFFGILKSELFSSKSFKSHNDLIKAIHDYINYYNHIRIKKKLDFLSPVEYRLKNCLN